MTSPDRWWRFAAPFLALYGTSLLAACWYTGFHVPENDFLFISSAARSLDLASPNTWYHGFYPFFYLLLLALLKPFDLFVAAAIINVLTCVGMLIASAWAAQRLLDGPWRAVFLVALALHPLIVRYSLTPGSNIGVACFTTIAGMLLLMEIGRNRGEADRRLLLIGMLLGIGALWRHHGLVFGGAFCLAYLICERRARSFAVLLIGIGAVYSLQLLVNLSSGHGLLETAHSFNVYRLMYGMNWHQIPDIPDSMAGVIAKSPRRFIAVYSGELRTYWAYLLVPWLNLLWHVNSPGFRRALFLALATLLYLAVLLAGGSVRGLIPLVPFLLLAAVQVLARSVLLIRDRPRSPAALAALGACLVLLYAVLPAVKLPREAADLLRSWRSTAERDRILEAELVDREGIRSPQQILTDKFALYLRGLPPYLPATIGGWPAYLRRKEGAPESSGALRDIGELLTYCQERGITHLVFSPAARNVSRLWRRIYDRSQHEPEIRFVRQIEGYRIFRIHSDETLPRPGSSPRGPGR